MQLLSVCLPFKWSVRSLALENVKCQPQDVLFIFSFISILYFPYIKEKKKSFIWNYLEQKRADDLNESVKCELDN